MMLPVLFLFLSYGCLVLTSADDVMELTDSDFSSKIKSYDNMLVMFYAPWCGHCKKLKPEFEKAASILRTNDPAVILAKVDCTESGKETCNKFSVSGYPTLKIFKDGELIKEYQGPREAGGFVKYMKSQVGPSAKELTSLSQYEKFLDEPEAGVIGFFKSSSDLKDVFLKVADKLREKFRFGISSSEDVLAAEKIEDGIVLYRPKHMKNVFEPNSVKYEGKNTKEDVETWLKANIHGLVDHRQRDNMEDFKNPLVVAYYNVDYAKDPKGTNYWRNRILKIAQKYSKDFTFAISAKDHFQHELNEYGFDYVPSTKPIVCARNAENKKFVMSDEFSMENFENFLSKLASGELSPYLKSEPIPDNNDKPVKVAVAKNFDDVVINSGKDTLIEFYAPWCVHCKKLAPIWDELGEKMADEEVDIVKMDATNNDVPSPFEVRGFPTLYWAAKNSKEKPVQYSGGRDIDDLIKYIAREATKELKGFDRKGNPKGKGKVEL